MSFVIPAVLIVIFASFCYHAFISYYKIIFYKNY